MGDVKRLPLFDWLRLGLALEVVVGHFIYPLSFPAVACFLALSGFLVSGSLARNGAGIEFFKRRALRVLPAFVVGLALVYALFGSPELAKTLTYYLTLGFVGRPENRALWSLPFEEVAYVGLALAFAFKPKHFITVGLVVGACLCLYAPFCDRSGDQQVYRALPLLWSLLVGVWASQNVETLERFKGWGLPALIASGVGAWIMHDPTLWALIAAPAVLLVGMNRPNVPKIPDLSYGIYIYHMPIFAFGISVGLSVVACFAVTVAFAGCSWFLIEKPFLGLKDFRWNRVGVARPIGNRPQIDVV